MQETIYFTPLLSRSRGKSACIDSWIKAFLFILVTHSFIEEKKEQERLESRENIAALTSTHYVIIILAMGDMSKHLHFWRV